MGELKTTAIVFFTIGFAGFMSRFKESSAEPHILFIVHILTLVSFFIALVLTLIEVYLDSKKNKESFLSAFFRFPTSCVFFV